MTVWATSLSSRRRGKVYREEKAHYIIKRNLHRETPEEWLEIASVWRPASTRSIASRYPGRNRSNPKTF
ncbi:MAG: hypothetical protein AAGB97_06150 [Dehalococcoidia bacterium]